MAGVLINVLIEELGSITFHWIEDQVTMTMNAEEDVAMLKSNFLAIQAVLADAEKKQWKLNENQRLMLWLDKLEDVSYDVDDVLDAWKTFLLKMKIEQGGESATDTEAVLVPKKQKKVRFFIPTSCFCFRKVKQVSACHDVAIKIKELNKRLKLIGDEKNDYNLASEDVNVERPRRPITTSFPVDETKIIGRDLEKEALVGNLLSSNSNHEGKGFGIIPIVGIGGLGKTTLAQQAYNDKGITGHFDKKIWVCVSDLFDEFKIAKAIIEALGGNTGLVELEALLKEIAKLIDGKKFLLVLDDMWSEEEDRWVHLVAPLKKGSAGSRILVTTQKKGVAIMMKAANRMINLEELPEKDCWMIFRQQAFEGRSERDCQRLEGIGQEIARKCKGLPLIAKILGSFMRYKETEVEWESILHSELWELKNKDAIFAPFLMCYYGLSPVEKRCFLYCSVFPKDHVIKVERLFQLWMSQGYFGAYGIKSEEECQDCFNSLALRSFFQEFKKDEFTGIIISCKMHDSVHDFAQFLNRKEFASMEAEEVNEKKMPLDERVRHLTVVVGHRIQFPTLEYSMNNRKNLRTLVVLGSDLYSQNGLDGSQFLHLTHLRALTLSNCGLPNLPQGLGKLIHLRFLDLSENDLRELPAEMFGLCNLQVLILSGCRLEALQSDVGKLTELRHLDLSWNYLSELPNTLCSLQNLRTLHLCDCRLEKLPDNFGMLLQLRSLDLSSNPLKALPSTIGNLRHLQHLDLHLRNLRRLPEDIGKLERLEHLNLQGNENLERLPDRISDLSKLQRLDIGGCSRINELPDEVGKLRNLRYLDASFVCFLEFPDALCELYNLEVLKLFKCYLVKISEHFGKLSNLRDLCLGFNMLKKLPVSICNLYKLQELDISWCKELQRLPEGMCNLYNLQRLNISNCSKLRRLPKGTRKLANLRYLEFCGCRELEGLPKELKERDCIKPTDVVIVPKDNEAFLDFGDLNLIGGFRDYIVTGCANLTDADATKRLGIMMKDLTEWHLKFRNVRELRKWSKDQYGIEHDKEILESFDPPSNLTCLKVENYLGTTISPRWIMSCNLTDLMLAGCFNCETLPPLGKLPFLKRLYIRGMIRVKKLSLEFLGIPEIRDEEYGAKKLAFASFPRLKRLEFEIMPQWEEWEGGVIATDDANLTIMPSLRFLYFSVCNSLKVLPDFLPSVPLTMLCIDRCKILEQCCQKETGKEWLKVSHIPLIEINGKSVQEGGVWIQEDSGVLGTSQSDDVIDITSLFSESIAKIET